MSLSSKKGQRRPPPAQGALGAGRRSPEPNVILGEFFNPSRPQLPTPTRSGLAISACQGPGQGYRRWKQAKGATCLHPGRGCSYLKHHHPRL